MNQKKCPNCSHFLEVKKIIFAKGIFEIEVWDCHHCQSTIPKKIVKDVYKDITDRKFEEQKKFAEKMAKKFLPEQKVKVRFVEKLITATLVGETRIWRLTNEVIDICFPRKTLRDQDLFIEALPHELAHASDEVRLNPKHDPYSLQFTNECSRCGIPHPGEGHDKIWHDKYDELAKKVEKEYSLWIKKK